MKIIVLFIILQFFNVLLQTVKSVLTVKGSRLVAAISNAIAYGVYMFVIIYTVADFNIWIKVAITVVTNFFGVYISKYILDKVRKDRLWQIVVTVNKQFMGMFREELETENISFSIFDLLEYNNKHFYEFHVFSHNKNESEKIKNLIKRYGCKYIVQEEQVRL